MEEEMYSYDRYKGHSIIIMQYKDQYEVCVYHNGTCYFSKSCDCPVQSLRYGKKWVDSNLEGE